MTKPTIIITKDGKQVASSKDLEVLSRYARKPKVFVSRATATKRVGGGGLLKVWYSDGAKAWTNFSSYAVLVDWLAKKRRRLGW